MIINRSVTRMFLLLTLPAFALLGNPGVKHSTVTKMKFHGFMGSMMKMAGGDKPHSSTNYVQGDFQRSDNFDDKGNPTNSTIIDLNREVYITLDHKKKEYTEMTFAQWKEMMSKMMGRASTADKRGDDKQADVKIDFDVKVERTGEKKTIAGFNTEKVVLTMTATGAKETTPQEQGGKGGMIITSAMWLAKDASGFEELAAFSRKFSEKLGMDISAAGGQSMAAALQSNPQLANAMKKLAEESKKMQGFSVLTESKFETTAEAGSAQMPQMSAEDQEKMAKLPKSLGGLLGKMGPKQGGADSGSNVLYETTVETTEYKTGSFNADLFTVPAGYKAVKHPMMKN